MKLDETTTHALLERYGILPPNGERAIPSGTALAIDGIDDGGRHILRVRTPAHAAERMVPIGEAGAAELLDGVRAHNHHARKPAQRHMLAHLFQHVSDLFESSGVRSLTLDVRLHENAYTVVDAAFYADSAMHVTERLGRHGRDSKTFHSSGMQ